MRSTQDPLAASDQVAPCRQLVHDCLCCAGDDRQWRSQLMTRVTSKAPLALQELLSLVAMLCEGTCQHTNLITRVLKWKRHLLALNGLGQARDGGNNSCCGQSANPERTEYAKEYDNSRVGIYYMLKICISLSILQKVVPLSIQVEDQQVPYIRLLDVMVARLVLKQGAWYRPRIIEPTACFHARLQTLGYVALNLQRFTMKPFRYHVGSQIIVVKLLGCDYYPHDAHHQQHERNRDARLQRHLAKDAFHGETSTPLIPARPSQRREAASPPHEPFRQGHWRSPCRCTDEAHGYAFAERRLPAVPHPRASTPSPAS